MVDTAKIKGCMAENGDTQADVAKILNLSQRSVNLKLNNKTCFTIEELATLATRYNKNLDSFIRLKS